MIMSEPAIELLSGRGPTRGWCPGVLDPMETGDGWLLRIRVPGGFVTSESLRSVAELAAEFGSGIVDITSRANLQIRGVPGERLDRATAAVVEAGLVGDDARRDAFRAVVSSPLTGHDLAVCDARPVVEDVVSRLVGGIAGDAPSKFGIVIDDGGRWPLGSLDADIALRANRDGSWQVRLRGAREPIGCTTEPARVAEAATQWCVAEGTRMDRLVVDVGIAGIVARLALVAGAPDLPARSLPIQFGRLVGVVSHADEGRANVVAAPFLGRVNHEVLTEVADLATAHGADLRLTSDHSFAFCGVAVAAPAELVGELGELGLVVDRDDPRAQISACVGSAGCLWAHADTLTAGAELAASGSADGRLHLSACAKHCGAPSGVRHLIADANGTFR